MFSYSWEGLIGADHPLRFIRAFVDALDLEELGFYEECEGMGRQRYSANLLLKLVLYGYGHRMWSYGELEVAVQNHIGAIWLTGGQYS